MLLEGKEFQVHACGGGNEATGVCVYEREREVSDCGAKQRWLCVEKELNICKLSVS